MKLFVFLSIISVSSITNALGFSYIVSPDQIGFKISLPTFQGNSNTSLETVNKLDLYFSISEQELIDNNQDIQKWNDAGFTPPQLATYYGLDNNEWVNFIIDYDFEFKDGTLHSGQTVPNFIRNNLEGDPYFFWLDNNAYLENSNVLAEWPINTSSNYYSFDSWSTFSVNNVNFQLTFFGHPLAYLYDLDSMPSGTNVNNPSGGELHDEILVSTLSEVPEPSSYALLLGSLALGLVALRRR